MIKALLGASPFIFALLFAAAASVSAVYGVFLLAGAAWAFIAAAIPLAAAAVILIRGILA